MRPPTLHRRSSEQAAGQRVLPRNYPHHNHNNSEEAIPVVDLTSSPALRPLSRLPQSSMGKDQWRLPPDSCGDIATAAAKVEAEAEPEVPRKRFECPLCLREERVEGRPQVTIITDCCGNPPPSPTPSLHLNRVERTMGRLKVDLQAMSFANVVFTSLPVSAIKLVVVVTIGRRGHVVRGVARTGSAFLTGSRLVLSRRGN